MAYITREDGEHFVIPSYRDVLASKNKAQLKKDILLLSQSYGEYITMQAKGPNQYEVAFSPDTGYLLGESIWHFFKRPQDLIYCEAIPNTTEVILVIVKNGSVYLDGSFPAESIPEELVIFLTQQNSFEIYTYGDVPISETPEEGKFSFEPGSVSSFTVLDQPVFPTLPLLKIYQLRLVEQVLKSYGIGVFPLKPLLMLILLGVLGWMLWSYLSRPEEIVAPAAPQINPYQLYNDTLASPAPEQELRQFINALKTLYTLPAGWVPVNVTYTKGNVVALVQSSGNTTKALFDWAQQNNGSIEIKTNGMYVNLGFTLANRPVPKTIYPLKQVIGIFVDRLASVYPGNHLKLGEFSPKGPFTEVVLTVDVAEVTLLNLSSIMEQVVGMPFVLREIKLVVTNGMFSGSIIFTALGS